MRARGLKLTKHGLGKIAKDESRPMRARGLKPRHNSLDCCYFYVAPHAGAWIETADTTSGSCAGSVAPHAGAWIETDDTHNYSTWYWPSRPMRARGLKHSYRPGLATELCRAPCGRVD